MPKVTQQQCQLRCKLCTEQSVEQLLQTEAFRKWQELKEQEWAKRKKRTIAACFLAVVVLGFLAHGALHQPLQVQRPSFNYIVVGSDVCLLYSVYLCLKAANHHQSNRSCLWAEHILP